MPIVAAYTHSEGFSKVRQKQMRIKKKQKQNFFRIVNVKQGGRNKTKQT